ncbi:hypothetical protein GS506_09180 [Rhodococcus hoagii]|nr:hypothetical protein [Prescottella equi]
MTTVTEPCRGRGASNKGYGRDSSTVRHGGRGDEHMDFARGSGHRADGGLDAVRLDFDGDGLVDDAMWDSDGDGRVRPRGPRRRRSRGPLLRRSGPKRAVGTADSANRSRPVRRRGGGRVDFDGDGDRDDASVDADGDGTPRLRPRRDAGFVPVRHVVRRGGGAGTDVDAAEPTATETDGWTRRGGKASSR